MQRKPPGRAGNGKIDPLKFKVESRHLGALSLSPIFNGSWGVVVNNLTGIAKPQLKSVLERLIRFTPCMLTEKEVINHSCVGEMIRRFTAIKKESDGNNPEPLCANLVMEVLEFDRKDLTGKLKIFISFGAKSTPPTIYGVIDFKVEMQTLSQKMLPQEHAKE